MINQLRETAIMAIVRTSSSESARDLANALLDAQVSVLEFTTTTPDVFDLIEEFSARPGVRIGVGTALTAEHVAAGKRAGAQFVVSPGTDVEVIKATKRAGLISLPGVITPTDVATALAAGCDGLKLFPASPFGPALLKAIREPFPNQFWVPTGGITIESIEAWTLAGASAFGLGGPLTAGGLDQAPKRAQDFRNEIARTRGLVK